MKKNKPKIQWITVEDDMTDGDMFTCSVPPVFVDERQIQKTLIEGLVFITLLEAKYSPLLKTNANN